MGIFLNQNMQLSFPNHEQKGIIKNLEKMSILYNFFLTTVLVRVLLVVHFCMLMLHISLTFNFQRMMERHVWYIPILPIIEKNIFSNFWCAYYAAKSYNPDHLIIKNCKDKNYGLKHIQLRRLAQKRSQITLSTKIINMGERILFNHSI